MKKRITIFLSALMLFAFGALSVRADEPTIITFQSNQKALISSDFSKRLQALPEWEPFFQAFTDACDKALNHELSRDKLEKRFPSKLVDEIRRHVDKGISTRKGIEEYFKHVEAIVFELQADFDEDDIDENLQDITDLILGRKKDLDLNLDGVLAFVIDADPRKGFPILEYFREGKDYKFLRNEPGGDFVLEFDFEFRGREIEFCCAGVKMKGENRYAVIFSEDDSISQYCNAFKTGRYADLDTSKPFKEFTVEESCFRFLDRQFKRAGWESNGTEFFGKIKRVTTSVRDVDGVTQFDVSAEMRSAEDAQSVRDLLAGLVAFAQLSQNDNNSVKELLQSIRFDVQENRVSANVKLDSPELWKLISHGLDKATREIEKRR